MCGGECVCVRGWECVCVCGGSVAVCVNRVQKRPNDTTHTKHTTTPSAHSYSRIHKEPGHEEETNTEQSDGQVGVHRWIHWAHVANHRIQILCDQYNNIIIMCMDMCIVLDPKAWFWNWL